MGYRRINCAFCHFYEPAKIYRQRVRSLSDARAAKELVSAFSVFKYENLERMMQVCFIAIIFIFLHRIFTKVFVMLIFSHIKVHRKFCKSSKVFWCV